MSHIKKKKPLKLKYHRTFLNMYFIIHVHVFLLVTYLGG